MEIAVGAAGLRGGNCHSSLGGSTPLASTAPWDTSLLDKNLVYDILFSRMAIPASHLWGDQEPSPKPEVVFWLLKISKAARRTRDLYSKNLFVNIFLTNCSIFLNKFSIFISLIIIFNFQSRILGTISNSHSIFNNQFLNNFLIL